jgi:hypothetical protein
VNKAKILNLAAASVICVVGASGCSKVVDALLFERHTIKSGEFRGFEIGMSERSAALRIRQLGVTKIETPRASMGCAISNTDVKLAGTYDLWQFYNSSVHPNGATYCLWFESDHLKRIEYLRERVQVE